LVAQSIEFMDYSWDDPSPSATWTTLSIPTAADKVDKAATIPVSSLSVGTHTLYVRSHMTGDTATAAFGRTVYIAPPAPLGAQTLTDLEWYQSVDPGSIESQDVLDGAKVNARFAINIAAYEDVLGIQQFYGRFVTSSGQRSAALGRTFIITPLAVENAPNCREMEYFVNTDPGVGNGFIYDIDPDRPLAHVTIAHPHSAFGLGRDTLYARFLGDFTDNLNNLTQWGAAFGRVFYVTEPGAGAGEGVADGDADVTIASREDRTTFPLCPVDGAFDELQEDAVAYIPAEQIPQGQVTVGVRYHNTRNLESSIVQDTSVIGGPVPFHLVIDRNPDSTMTLTWNSWPFALEYNVYSDTIANGSYANHRATISRPDTTLTLPRLPGPRAKEFFRVMAGRVDTTCGQQVLRWSAPAVIASQATGN
jgi:hypothetical protein